MADGASVAEGVAAVQVTLADTPDEAEQADDAEVEAADEEAEATDAGAHGEALATLGDAEEAVAEAQIADGTAVEGAEGGDGGEEEAAPIGLKIDRAIPVPPRGPPTENPNVIRRGTDPAVPKEVIIEARRGGLSRLCFWGAPLRRKSVMASEADVLRRALSLCLPPGNPCVEAGAGGGGRRGGDGRAEQAQVLRRRGARPRPQPALPRALSTPHPL